MNKCKGKTNKQKTNKQTKTTLLFCLSCLSIPSSFALASLGAAVYHAVDPCVQTALFANVHYAMCCWSDSRPLTAILDPH